MLLLTAANRNVSAQPSTLKLLQFALSPSDFSSTEVAEEELEEPASQGVRILYRFPWGPEPLETLWMRGNRELLQMHKGVRSKLQVSLLLCFPSSFYRFIDNDMEKIRFGIVSEHVDRGVLLVRHLFNLLLFLKQMDFISTHFCLRFSGPSSV